MDFLKVPRPGQRINVVGSGEEDGMATVISVQRYTGAYPAFFTHVVRYTAQNTRRGWMEIAANVADFPNR